MARLKSIAIGPGRGSAGDATYRMVRGRTIMSRRITESSSNTPAQAEQRSLFASVQAMLKEYRVWPDLLIEPSKYGSSVNRIQTLNKDAFRDVWSRANDIVPAQFVKELWDGAQHYSGDVALAKGTLRYINTETSYPDLVYSDPELIVMDADVLTNLANPTITFVAIEINRQTLQWDIRTATLALDLVDEETAITLTDAALQTFALNGVLKCFIGVDGNLRIFLPYQEQAAGGRGIYSANPDLEAYLQLYLPNDDYTNLFNSYEAAGTLFSDPEEPAPRIGVNTIIIGKKIASVTLLH